MNTSNRFKVTQVAGSLRMEGVVVSGQDEQLMAGILEGKIDASEERRRLVAQFKKQNAARTG